MGQRVLIAGAGVAGLVSALALRQRGMEVSIIESAPEFGEAGAGIQLSPNAMKVIAALGLEREVMRTACEPEAIVIADTHSGKPISRMLLGRATRECYGQAYITLHRSDLHSVLLRSVQAAGVSLYKNQTLQKYEHEENQICGLTQDASYACDVLIGADGLWSRVASCMLGPVAPRATGHAAFRTLLAAEDVPALLRTMHIRLWWGRHVHVVAYPIRGGSMWNVIVLARHCSDASQGWCIKAEHGQVMQHLPLTEPTLTALLHAVPCAGAVWRKWNLFDRDPLAARDVTRGRVALIGDAAHPMLPYLAQGASMGIEDSWVLAACLSDDESPERGLCRYANLRVSRQAKVVRSARRNSLIFHLSGPMAAARNAVMAVKGTTVVGLPWLYGYDVTQDALR